MIKVRFAPSPTGYLHVGNARVALINWLFAKAQGGQFILRFDDTDIERSKPEYVEAIRRDLSWLGLDWDAEEFQSKRLERYQAAAEKLKADGRLYPCYETSQELEFKRKLQLSRKQPPVYDRAALKLSAGEKAALEAEGRKPHWRFKLSAAKASWNDQARHHDIAIDLASVSDPVLVREDGTFLYTLPSVIDDIDMGITHVIRGEDHITNAGVQIDLTQALGAVPPAYAHLSLLIDASGKGFSKREGSASLQELRETGFENLALCAYLARLGSAHAPEPVLSLRELIQGFDLADFSHSTPHVDLVELERLNAKLLHQMPYEMAQERLGLDEGFWLGVRGNLKKLSDAKQWWDILRQPVAPAIEDGEFTAIAAGLLPVEPWDETTWPAFTAKVKESTGRSGKALFHPLRLALTGQEQGPEMKTLLPLIGRTRAEARLKGITA
ncbi:Glutamate--tRNA ligase 1 [Rhodospirillaceae bacterium LM-1]|nr:Glutamate--tRNA ligase 1 [Rhodospirillaceae bacterium LM-1]